MCAVHTGPWAAPWGAGEGAPPLPGQLLLCVSRGGAWLPFRGLKYSWGARGVCTACMHAHLCVSLHAHPPSPCMSPPPSACTRTLRAPPPLQAPRRVHPLCVHAHTCEAAHAHGRPPAGDTHLPPSRHHTKAATLVLLHCLILGGLGRVRPRQRGPGPAGRGAGTQDGAGGGEEASGRTGRGAATSTWTPAPARPHPPAPLPPPRTPPHPPLSPASAGPGRGDVTRRRRDAAPVSQLASCTAADTSRGCLWCSEAG